MSHPGHGGTARHEPRLIAWELTRSCNLNCRHCRAAAEQGPYKGELTLDEVKRVVDNINAVLPPEDPS